MLTTCPECHTSFRVSQAQLDHRRGLVRCGRCSAVFNAYDTLLPELATPAADTAAATTAAYRVAAPPADAEGAGATLVPRGPAQPPAPSADDGGPLTAANLPSDGDAFLSAWPGGPEQTQAAPTETATDRAVVTPDDSPSSSETADAILLSALPTDRKRGLPDWRATLWVLASLLLTMSFLLQTTYFLRAEIAAAWPETRPVLSDACLRLGCSLPLPRDVQAVRLDASSLETDPEDASHAILRVSLSNRSGRIIAWPHLILILTDVRDVPVAQRPFPPSDYLPDTALEARGMAPGEEREIRLDLELRGLSAYGYKLDKQYP